MTQFVGEYIKAPPGTAIRAAEGIGADERAVYAEYLAEATPAPVLMIRRGKYKFIASSHDGNLLFDLEKDPNERVNLANDMKFTALTQRFQAEVQGKWNKTELTARMVQSQKRRALVRRSTSNSASSRWNHGEEKGDAVLWYRGESSYNEWAFEYLPAIDPV